MCIFFKLSHNSLHESRCLVLLLMSFAYLIIPLIVCVSLLLISLTNIQYIRRIEVLIQDLANKMSKTDNEKDKVVCMCVM